ncbi:hypothetical protein MYX65_11905 [Acidobacteria bacterium AH-259-L09]|nr:hypothetical protein [Acidobacteria bacterium AH-259-L09]
MDLAVAEIRRAIEEAEQANREEDVCYLYARLSGVYFRQEDRQGAFSVYEECEDKFPDSYLAKFLHAEGLFWYARSYRQAIDKADEVIDLLQVPLSLYNRILYLKGVAHAELGEFQQAIEMLKKTRYYDLALVEKLVDNEVGLAECRDFLVDALERYDTYERGEHVEANRTKAEALLARINERRTDA